jgi:hypothetical protein
LCSGVTAAIFARSVWSSSAVHAFDQLVGQVTPAFFSRALLPYIPKPELMIDSP